HHPVASDRDDPRDLLEWNGGRTTELARRVRLHGLHDVAAKVAVLLAARLDGRAQIGAPDDLVGVALDVVALEEVFAPPVAGKVEDPAPERLERAGDREEDRVAQASSAEQHGLLGHDLRGLP